MFSEFETDTDKYLACRIWEAVYAGSAGGLEENVRPDLFDAYSGFWRIRCSQFCNTHIISYIYA